MWKQGIYGDVDDIHFFINRIYGYACEVRVLPLGLG